MELLKNTKSLVVAALMCAFTCIATMIIQIPTPTLGYIHPGDCLVLLCGIILGPAIGPLAAGVGSALADLFTGYAVYVIPTLIIKGFTAWIAAVVFRKLKSTWNKNLTTIFIAAGILAEINMVFGYFINKIIKTMFVASSFSKEMFLAGLTSAIGGIFPDVIQGVVGIVLGAMLLPILYKIPDVHLWMNIGVKQKKMVS